MHKRSSILTSKNIAREINRFSESIEGLGSSITNKRGMRLLESLKRDKVQAGPYPDVTLFEAANRIMSDLVILHGVQWLLKQPSFPFDSYKVVFGNEKKNVFDIQACRAGRRLVGEAFNVAKSFFQTKKSEMLNKLRRKGTNAHYKIIIVNDDAIAEGYSPRLQEREHFIFVNVKKRRARIVSNNVLHGMR